MKAHVLALAIGLSTFLSGGVALAATTTVYATQFEAAEGYSTALDLAGQAGWVYSGSGGNGVLANALENQSAYIGYAPPDPVDDALVLWKPINFNPMSTGYPIVNFSVLMNIIDSESTTNRDIFRWSVYNSIGDRLFSIDFDNLYLDIAYVLDGTNEVKFTYLPFVNESNYLLNITMNFASNRWSATYNGIKIATNQPITTTGALLDLGDVDAVWLVNLQNGTNAPGDNYMLFDNYRITAESPQVSPAQVALLGRTGEGWALLQVSGAEGTRWSVDTTTNLINWLPLKTNPIAGGYFDYVDQTAAGKPLRFYRARNVP